MIPPAVVVAAPIVVAMSPLLFVGALLADLGLRRPKMGITRLVAMGINYLLLECAGVVLALLLWLATGLGLQLQAPRSRRAHSAVQAWWARSMFAAARRWLGLRVEVDGEVGGERGPVIIAAHHASLLDAFLPAVLLGSRPDRAARYVLAVGLTWDPCLGIFGRRLPNHFVDRTSGDQRERRSIERLAATATDDEALVIFPEGTFRSATKPDRIFARLAADNPVRAERLQLSHMLPPRPGGILALMRGAHGARVVFLAHRGFEEFGSFRSIVANVPFTSPVQARLWHVPADQIGVNDSANLAVVDHYWQEMDDWIGGLLASGRFRSQ